MPTLLEIVSPDRLLLSQPVDMAVIPAAEGEMGVTPGHAPMIVLLRGGTITLYEGTRPTSRLFVSGGFAEVALHRVGGRGNPGRGGVPRAGRDPADGGNSRVGRGR